MFIKKSLNGFCIISVYIDDINIIGTCNEIEETSSCLKTKFEMKDLGKTKYCLSLQIEHLLEGIFIHLSTYSKKVFERFCMDKSHLLNTPMVVWSLEVDNSFRPKDDTEDILGP